MTRSYDVVVVGAGPAGLTAALYTGRANLKTIVLDRIGIGGGQLLNTELIEDYTGFKSVTGHELAELFQQHAETFGAEIAYGNVTEVVAAEDGCSVTVRTDDGEEYRARAVVVATGGLPRKLGVPGEAELAGRGVSYCAICDGAFFKGQQLAVVGGGDSAVEEATFLTRYASKVYIIHRRDQFRAQKILQERALANPKIEVIWNTVVEEIGGEGSVEWVRLRNVVTGEERKLPVGGVFIYIGFQPSSDLFPQGIKKDPLGFIITDDKMETSLPGVFCAGDVRSQYVRQITNAVGDATTAAIAATRRIEALEERCPPELVDEATEAALKATATQYP